MLWALLILILVLRVASMGGCVGDDVPRAYRRRRCEGRRWKEQFPDAPKEAIFVDAFGFCDKHRLKFSPDDRIGDVYKAVYGAHPSCDGLEIASLFCDVENTYSVDLEDGNAMDLTLGTLFRSAIKAKR
jgi:hypothetical protein